MAESLAQLNFNVLNEGKVPTFYTFRNNREYKSIVDVTFCTNDLLHRVKDWKVDADLVTLSDHRAIRFNVTLERTDNQPAKRNSTRRYNTSKADWATFAKTLNEETFKYGIDKSSVTNTVALEDFITLYVDCITTACTKAIPCISSTVREETSKWWTQQLADKKKVVIRLRTKIRKANPKRKPFVISEYTKNLQEYKLELLQAITSSWKTFCTRQEKETLWQCMYRILNKCSKTGEDKLLRSPTDQHMLTPLESAELLAQTLFPHDDPDLDTDEHKLFRLRTKECCLTLDSSASIQAFTQEEVEAVLHNMSPKKAPGEDGLTSDICLRAYHTDPELLLAIYNRCLELAYFPRIWKQATIKIIPKSNRSDYTIPKAYRPIGLLPILGKVLEKMFTNRLMWQLGKEGLLDKRQYGFMPQRSTEDALHAAKTKIDKAVREKKIAIAVSLDIEGAFDNAWWPAILYQLIKKQVDHQLTKLVISYLSSRSIKLIYAGQKVTRDTNRGCIQGSTCGPLLWNVLLDSLLEDTKDASVHVQAFADDVLIIGVNNDGRKLANSLNDVLQKVSMWGKRYKLKFSPSKTQVVLFTNKIKYEAGRLIMDGQELLYTPHMRVLGVTFDENMNFVNHIEHVTAKAVNLYKKISRAARAHWGLNSEIVKTIYVSVVEPTVLYAANVWADKSDTVQLKKRLDRTTRLFGLMISKAHRTVSLVSSALLSGILPLDLRAKEQKLLFLSKRGAPLPYLPEREMERLADPFSLPHPAKRVSFKYQQVSSAEDLEEITGGMLQIFTDGSKIDGKVGAAISCLVDCTEVRKKLLKLDSCCSVFQAELVALREAVAEISRRRILNAQIFSDSRSSLDCLADTRSLHPLVMHIQSGIRECRDNGCNIDLYWVKAHAGIAGNERADELAKTAALKSKTAPIYDKFPASTAKYLIRAGTLTEWQMRYSAATTGAVTRLFFPDSRVAFTTLRKISMDNLQAQIFTGHGGFKHYLHRFKLAQSPFCPCDDQTVETIEHILLECPRFTTDRMDCEGRMNLRLDRFTLCTAINSEKYRDYFLEFTRKVGRIAARSNGSTIE